MIRGSKKKPVYAVCGKIRIWNHKGSQSWDLATFEEYIKVNLSYWLFFTKTTHQNINEASTSFIHSPIHHSFHWACYQRFLSVAFYIWQRGAGIYIREEPCPWGGYHRVQYWRQQAYNQLESKREKGANQKRRMIGMWQAASHMALNDPASWYSCPYVIPTPALKVGLVQVALLSKSDGQGWCHRYMTYPHRALYSV